ncbi:MAG: hypothetical protein ACR2PH_07490 [Desulfobulbia bacterium]
MESDNTDVTAEKSKLDETESVSDSKLSSESPAISAVGEDDCETGTEYTICFESIDSELNCRWFRDPPYYRSCEVKLGYSLRSNLKGYASSKVECKAEIDYNGRYGWMEKTEEEYFRHTIDPDESDSGNIDFLFKFGRNRKVVDVKIDYVGCKIASVYEY